jgi:hypothetical protein
MRFATKADAMNLSSAVPPVKIAALLDQLERVNRPILGSRLDHVEMSKQ